MTGRTYIPLKRAGALLLLGALGAASACSSPTAPPPYDIISPASDTVSVLPHGSVQFETRVDPGITVEYRVDGAPVVNSPVFVFDPVLPEHTVTVLIRSASPLTTLLERDFVVVTEVPGNLPPEVLSLIVDNNKEALRDTVHARALVQDPDGSVQKIEIDFGDDTPVVRSVGKDTEIDAAHVYQAPGAYWVTVTVTDSVEITAADSTQVQVLPPNQLPVGLLTVSGDTEGDAPLTVTLIPQGMDPDGTIVLWELDEEGDGTFHAIPPLQPVQFSYPFREESFRPVLRLTDDDGDASTFQATTEILVFRSISASGSDVQVQGNPALSKPGNPFILADGQDRLTISVAVRNPQGQELRDVPVRITSLRPDLIAADGATNLGQSIDFNPGTVVETGSDGRAVAFITSATSTRVEAVPVINSIPFDIRIEASRGHGQWIELDPATGIETETLVDARLGSIVVTKQGGGGFCPGDTAVIRVTALDRTGAPARRKYTEIRYGQFINQVWFGARPLPSHADWRTDASGEILFNYVPTEFDRNRIIVAWVDGNVLSALSAFNFKAGC